jgi:hypothetical protein
MLRNGSVNVRTCAPDRRRVFRAIRQIAALIALSLLTLPAMAMSPEAGDPCAATSKDAAAPPQSRIQIERDAAINIVRHVQRACRLIDGLASDHSIQDGHSISIELRAIIDELRNGVLEYVYREYPDLRDQDLTATQGVLSKRLGQMGPATAIYLRWALTDARASLSRLSASLPCRGIEAGMCPSLDAGLEISSAADSAYVSFPGLWRLALKEGEALAAAQKRTPEGDAAFRKASPAPGSVRLSASAVAYIRDMLSSLRREGAGCQVAAVEWTLETRSKGPDDVDWKVAGPGLTAGAYGCGQIPPEVIQAIDGIRIVFIGDAASRFAGKVIDVENEHLVLKER